MDKATLTISLPQIMKDYITAKLAEGRFSTPSEYIRSLIRDDQDRDGNARLDLNRSRASIPPETASRPKREAGPRRK